MSSTNQVTRPMVMVLDDYANVSGPYIAEVQSKTQVEIHTHNATLNPKTQDGLNQLVNLLQPYEIILTMRERTPFLRDLLLQLPKLKLLLTTGPRNRSIDLATCKGQGIVVAGTGAKSNLVPNHSDTNEQNWALLLGLAKNIAEDDLRVKSEPGSWQGGMVYGLAGRTLALLGLGTLGLQCAVTGVLGFGMKAIAWSSNLTQEKVDEAGQSRGLPLGSIKVVSSKEELLRNADILSIHYVLSDRSRGILGKEDLALMKKTALLVNTSRGPLVDEAALLETLREGRIRGAAMDVFDIEPLPSDSPWRSQEWGKNGRSHVLLSPHNGYNEEETIHAMWRHNTDNLLRWLAGEDVVDKLQ